MTTKQQSELDGRAFLRESFAREQALLKTALDLSASSITHPGKQGEVNERLFIRALRAYLPCRYSVDSAIVIDSQGRTSDQIDVVVFDLQYTPSLLVQHEHRYVPAEAVYAVFEVKPAINKQTLEYAADKARSVRRLDRTSVPVTHSDGVKGKKDPFWIVAGILAADVHWKTGFRAPFRAVHQSLDGDRRLDCGFAASGHAFDVFEGEGAYTFEPQGNALMFFLFRLLGKLQSLGTVPAVNWSAYARALSGVG